MNTIEKRIQELYNYAPNTAAPSDLEDFWRDSLTGLALNRKRLVLLR